jgi:hypothetical protein
VDKGRPQASVVAVFGIAKSGSMKRRLAPPGGRGGSLAEKRGWFGHGWRPMAWAGGEKTFMEPPKVGRRSIKKDLQHGCHAEGLAHRFDPTTRPSAWAPVMLTLSRGATPLQKNITTEYPPESSSRNFRRVADMKWRIVMKQGAVRQTSRGLMPARGWAGARPTRPWLEESRVRRLSRSP